MTADIAEKQRTARLWDAWEKYQQAERDAYESYLTACRNLQQARDLGTAKAREAERAATQQAFAAYRHQVTEWLKKHGEQHTATGEQAATGIDAAWQEFMKIRQDAYSKMRSDETIIREQYRYDMSVASELYQRELGRAHQGWQAAIGPAEVPQ